jgi:hypothetical protein
MYEAVPADGLPVRQNLYAAVLNKLPSAGQLIAPRFYDCAILPQSGSHGGRRKLRPRHAGRLDRSLLRRIEVFELLLDHLLDTVGHPRLDALDLAG